MWWRLRSWAVLGSANVRVARRASTGPGCRPYPAGVAFHMEVERLRPTCVLPQLRAAPPGLCPRASCARSFATTKCRAIAARSARSFATSCVERYRLASWAPFSLVAKSIECGLTARSTRTRRFSLSTWRASVAARRLPWYVRPHLRCGDGECGGGCGHGRCWVPPMFA